MNEQQAFSGSLKRLNYHRLLWLSTSDAGSAAGQSSFESQLRAM